MKTSKELKKYQRKMRANPTPYEEMFARNLKELGINVKPQMIVGFYIVDFALPNKMLIIEIDGEVHSDPKQFTKDRNREWFLVNCGFKVWRIPNQDVPGFDIPKLLKKYPDRPLEEFRSALARANAIRSKAFKK